MTELIFQILTGLSLVFAGIIIGYFLWFRDRADSLALCQKLTVENKAMARIQNDKDNELSALKEQLKFEHDRHHQMRMHADEVVLTRESHSRKHNARESNCRRVASY